MHPRLDAQLRASHPSPGGILQIGRLQPRTEKVNAPRVLRVFLVAGANGRESSKRMAVRKLRDMPALLVS